MIKSPFAILLCLSLGLQLQVFAESAASYRHYTAPAKVKMKNTGVRGPTGVYVMDSSLAKKEGKDQSARNAVLEATKDILVEHGTSEEKFFELLPSIDVKLSGQYREYIVGYEGTPPVRSESVVPDQSFSGESAVFYTKVEETLFRSKGVHRGRKRHEGTRVTEEKVEIKEAALPRETHWYAEYRWKIKVGDLRQYVFKNLAVDSGRAMSVTIAVDFKVIAKNGFSDDAVVKEDAMSALRSHLLESGFSDVVDLDFYKEKILKNSAKDWDSLKKSEQNQILAFGEAMGAAINEKDENIAEKLEASFKSGDNGMNFLLDVAKADVMMIVRCRTFVKGPVAMSDVTIKSVSKTGKMLAENMAKDKALTGGDPLGGAAMATRKASLRAAKSLTDVTLKGLAGENREKQLAKERKAQDAKKPRAWTFVVKGTDDDVDAFYEVVDALVENEKVGNDQEPELEEEDRELKLTLVGTAYKVRSAVKKALKEDFDYSVKIDESSMTITLSEE